MSMMESDGALKAHLRDDLLLDDSSRDSRSGQLGQQVTKAIAMRLRRICDSNANAKTSSSASTCARLTCRLSSTLTFASPARGWGCGHSYFVALPSTEQNDR